MNALIPLLAGLFLSGIAAWYSIVGLIAIFPGAPLAVGLMGSALEIGKLVAASWVFQNWANGPRLLKAYLTGAVVVLMLITSMGIFGLLAKAHTATASDQSMNATRIEVIDSEISSRQKEVELIDTQLKNLDDALARYIELGAVSKGLKAVSERQEERKALAEERRTKVKEINQYKTERITLTDAKSKLEVEFGPVKYLADFIYGEGGDSIDRAVRLVILCIIFVFDPLAVLLLIAANYNWMVQHPQVRREKKEKNEIVNVEPVSVEAGVVPEVEEAPHNSRGWQWPADRGK